MIKKKNLSSRSVVTNDEAKIESDKLGTTAAQTAALLGEHYRKQKHLSSGNVPSAWEEPQDKKKSLEPNQVQFAK